MWQLTEFADVFSTNGNVIFGILWDYMIGAKAELFVFALAIFVHLSLFGTAFNRTIFPQKSVLEDKCKKAVTKASQASGVNLAESEPQSLEECEQQLQTAYAAGDFRSVLRFWVRMKRFESMPLVDLAIVVESMQRLKKETSSVVGELRAFFIRHPQRCQVDEMNLLLEASAKSLDTDLVEGLLQMMKELNLEEDDLSYEIMLSMYFTTRDFSMIRQTVAIMKSKNVRITMRASAVLLKTALRSNDFDEVKQRFKEIAESPTPPPVHLILQIVEMACKTHRLHEVLPLLESMPNVDYTHDSINAMLTEAVQKRDAALFAKIERLARSGPAVSLNAKSYQLLLKAATTVHDFERARTLIQEALESGTEIAPELAVAIIDFCIASGETAHAEALLKCTKATQTQVVAAVIRFFCEFNLYVRACDIYEWWRSERCSTPEKLYVNPRFDVRTERCVADAAMMCGRQSTVMSLVESSPADVAKHITMIQACSARHNLDGAFTIFEALQKNGAELTLSIYNTMLDACVECRNLARAEKWMKTMREVNKVDVVSYNTIIKAQVAADCFQDARALMHQMVEEGMKPNHITYNELINGYIRTRKISKVWDVVAEMQSAGVTPNHVTCSILLKNLSQMSSKSDVLQTMELISKIEEPMDEVLLSSVMEACVRVGKPELLTQKLALLQENNLTTVNGAHTFGSLIKAYGRVGDMQGAWKCWREMRSRHIHPSSITIGCMVECIASNGDSEGAYELLLSLLEDKDCYSEVNAVSFGSVLKAFSREKKMDRAWAIFEDMKRYNVSPIVTTYNMLCDACTTNSQMDRIPMLIAHMKKSGVTPNLITFSTLLKGHCQKGDMQAAFEILTQMRKTTDLKPDEIMYNTLLDGCGTHGMINEGKNVFIQMEKEGIKPSNYTLSVLVKLMGNARQIDEVFELVASTTDKYGFKANAHVYANLVQACVANKKLPYALQVLQGMAKDKQQPDIRTYSTTIRACINAGMFEDATRLARAALGLSGCEPYPFRNPAMAPKGARLQDNIVNELLKVLRTHGYAEQLANPLVEDIQQSLPQVKIQTKKAGMGAHPWRNGK